MTTLLLYFSPIISHLLLLFSLPSNIPNSWVSSDFFWKEGWSDKERNPHASMVLSTQQAGFKNHSTGISALVIQAFKQQIYPSICTSCLVGTTDYFNKTTCSVIKCLSLFAHSSILQFKIMETYDSRFFQTIEKNRKKKTFFLFPKI